MPTNARCLASSSAANFNTILIFCFENLSFAECKEKGINDSSIHVDFMIGTADLEIDGVTADGKVVPLFRKGNWAF